MVTRDPKEGNVEADLSATGAHFKQDDWRAKIVPALINRWNYANENHRGPTHDVGDLRRRADQAATHTQRNQRIDYTP